tara:strand:+ start:988 stop:1794 length:807 start_codon:yes stop_codon:yes gene_type:complete
LNREDEGIDVAAEARSPAEVFFDALNGQLRTIGLRLMCFGDFVELLPSYEGGVRLCKEGQEELAAFFETHLLASIPQVHRGTVVRTLSSPIVVFQDSGLIDKSSESFRYASMVTKAAAVMAKSDSVVSEEESSRVLERVEGLPYLTADQKLYLKALSLYLLSSETRRDLLVKKVSDASPALRNTIVEVAMDIAIADGVLEEAEVGFLQDLYRAFDMDVRSARKDLEKYAREHYIVLEKRREATANLSENTIDEFDDVLGDLLTEFDFE